MSKRKDVIEPIDAPFDEVVNSIVERTQDQPSNIKSKNMPQEEKRVLSSSSTTKAIADIDRGSLQDYIGQKNLNPFIDKDKILQETIRFTIPGTQWIAVGITTEQFELICRGYVQALYEGAPGRLPSAVPYLPRLSRAPAWTHLSMRPRATSMNGLRTPCSASCEPFT